MRLLNQASGGLIVLALLLSGCSGNSADSLRPSSEEAKRLLETALDAWKEGASKSLASGVPPIRLVDQDQAIGQGLTGYRLDGEPEPVGPALNFPVELSLRDRKGKSRVLKTMYQVVLAPSAAVIRNDP